MEAGFDLLDGQLAVDHANRGEALALALDGPPASPSSPALLSLWCEQFKV
jgi:hypothetical protein